MERLTEEKQIGPFASLKDKAEAKVGAFADYDCLYAHMTAVTKLKEYEDTGLTPEQVAAMKAELQDERYRHDRQADFTVGQGQVIDQLKEQLRAYEDTGLTPEKIAGIACELQVYRNAGKDGRLPLLLCKVDDTVYVVLVGRVFPFEVISVMLHGDTPTFKAQHGMHLCWVFGNDDIGKTVFLNREEAEAALERPEEVRDHA